MHLFKQYEVLGLIELFKLVTCFDFLSYTITQRHSFRAIIKHFLLLIISNHSCVSLISMNFTFTSSVSLTSTHQVALNDEEDIYAVPPFDEEGLYSELDKYRMQYLPRSSIK